MSGSPPDADQPSQSTIGSPPPEAFPVPLEDPSSGIVAGFLRTIGLFVASPAEGFRRLRASDGVFRPLVYYVLLGWIAEGVALLYGIALSSLRIGQMDPAMLGRLPPALADMLENQGAYAAASAILAPVKLVILLIVLGAIFHGLLTLLGGANAGFKTTLRIVCYAGTARLALLVPICGGLVAVVWSMALWIVGLAVAHRTSYGRAAVAVVVPLLLCCACLAALAVAAFAGLASMAGSWR